MSKQIAFLGVGAMGGRMAANLVQAGFDVRGFSPSAATRRAAADRGVPVVDSCAAARQLITTAGALGHARSDMTAVAEAYAQLAGLDAQRGSAPASQPPANQPPANQPPASRDRA